MKRRVVILGAAGRDFHNFNVRFREDALTDVVAFTATQIPGISGRTYPAALAGSRYPEGIPIVSEQQLTQLVRSRAVDSVVFAYSDVTHEHVMHLACLALSAGAGFALLGTRETTLASRRPVVAVVATRTGAGKSTVSRYVVRALRGAGLRPVVVRHPMPYETLHAGVERYTTPDEVVRSGISVEAMEEYQQHVCEGTVVFAGVDYANVLAAAERESDVIVWDGGNNDTPFFRPTVTVTVLDPTRPGEEDRYFPGEVNARSADVLVIGKVNVARPTAIDACAAKARALNPTAPIVRMQSVASMTQRMEIAGVRVVAVDDGPSLTHGGMPEGVAAHFARDAGAVLVDPRPWAVGSIADALEAYPHIGCALPALGYGARQLADLERTIAATPCDVVLLGTPALLESLVEIGRPVARVGFAATDTPGSSLSREVLDRLGRGAT